MSCLCTSIVTILTRSMTFNQLTKLHLNSFIKMSSDFKHTDLQDCLGMTPLRILACSSNGQGVEVFQCMIEKKYPNALLIEDRWGDIPLTYALYAEASIAVIYFLFKTHRQMWGTCPLILAI